MALPLLPIGLGLAALGGLLLLSKDSPSSPSSPSGPSGPASPTGPGPMPPALQTVFSQLLTNENVNPDDLDRFATELEKYGYTREAAQLRARAAQLRARGGSGPVPVPPIPPIPPIPNVTPPPIPIPPIPPIPTPPIPNLDDILPKPPTPGTFQPNGLAIAPGGVYVRDQPHESGAIVSQELTMGTPVQILGRLSTPTPASPQGWTELVTPNGVKGYAASQWIQGGGALPSPTPSPTPTLATAIVTTANDPLNMRSGPGESNGLVGTAAKGSTVTVLATGFPPTAAAPLGWSKIRNAQGLEGYASSQYLRPTLSTSGWWDIE